MNNVLTILKEWGLQVVVIIAIIIAVLIFALNSRGVLGFGTGSGGGKASNSLIISQSPSNSSPQNKTEAIIKEMQIDIKDLKKDLILIEETLIPTINNLESELSSYRNEYQNWLDETDQTRREYQNWVDELTQIRSEYQELLNNFRNEVDLVRTVYSNHNALQNALNRSNDLLERLEVIIDPIYKGNFVSSVTELQLGVQNPGPGPLTQRLIDVGGNPENLTDFERTELYNQNSRIRISLDYNRFSINHVDLINRNPNMELITGRADTVPFHQMLTSRVIDCKDILGNTLLEECISNYSSPVMWIRSLVTVPLSEEISTRSRNGSVCTPSIEGSWTYYIEDNRYTSTEINLIGFKIWVWNDDLGDGPVGYWLDDLISWDDLDFYLRMRMAGQGDKNNLLRDNNLILLIAPNIDSRNNHLVENMERVNTNFIVSVDCNP